MKRLLIALALLIAAPAWAEPINLSGALTVTEDINTTSSIVETPMPPQGGTIRILSDTDAWFAFASTTESLIADQSTSIALIANTPENFRINPGTNWIAVRASSAGGQLMITAQGFEPRPLDVFADNLHNAYSFRCLLSRYQEAIIRLRRDSDDAAQNFGCNSDSNLDTSAVSAFVGSDTAYVVTLFDQSANGRHLSQATNGNQPAYIANGQNGRPGMVFDGSTSSRYLFRESGTYLYSNNGPLTLSMVYDNPAAGFEVMWGETNQSDTDTRHNLLHSNVDTFGYLVTTDAAAGIHNDVSDSASVGAAAAIAVGRTSGTVNYYLDGIADGDSSYTPSGTTTIDRETIGVLFRGAATIGDQFSGEIFEFVSLSVELSQADMITVQQEQARYWGIN